MAYQQGGGPPPGQIAGHQAAWQPGQGGPYQWDNLPDDDPIDNPNEGPPQYGHPPMDGMHQVQGYDNVGAFGTTNPCPPPPPLPPQTGEPPPMQFDSVANLSESQCREAMLDFVAEQCCYGKAPAQEMTVQTIAPSSALHYTLETFSESRSTGYADEPFRGQPIDGPEFGMPPSSWQIPCHHDELFRDHTKRLEVPHTARVQSCHVCSGRGFNRCYRCHGRGQVRCHSCGGDGHVTRHNAEGHSYQEHCHSCGGDGRRRCTTCGGDGRVTCEKCQGCRALKVFIQLTVQFINHMSDHIMEKTDMPDELVRDVGGIPIFEQALPQIWPIVAYPVAEINQNSLRLVDHHRQAFATERQIHQRQILRAVPVTECRYLWKDVNTRFWVYGTNRKVHSPDYPQQCCWGCTII